MSRLHWLVVGSLLVGCAGCGKSDTPKPKPLPPIAFKGYAQDGNIKFLDDVQSNTALDAGIRDLTLLGVDGKETSVETLQAGKNLILIVTRGNTEPICPYCSTQVASYIQNYAAIADRQAQVLVLYPVEKLADGPRKELFLQKSREVLNDPNRPIPFPVLLDVELKAVDALGIRRNLSKPATYLLDRSGRVQFAYVGNSLADRPSVGAMLLELDKINGAATSK